MKHLIEPETVDMAWTACGIHRAELDRKDETRQHKKVTCKACKKRLKERKGG